MTSKVHSFPIRVYFEDTDAGGIVYHASYLRFMERARTEMLRDGGIDHAGMVRNEKIMFVVKSCAIEYHRPAKLDDMLAVETTVADMGNASLTLTQNTFRAGEKLTTAQVVLVCINGNGTPCRIPANIRSTIG